MESDVSFPGVAHELGGSRALAEIAEMGAESVDVEGAPVIDPSRHRRTGQLVPSSSAS